jgi:hypothetical protein
MVGWEIDYRIGNIGRKWDNRGTLTDFAYGDWRKPHNLSVTKAEIRT